MRLKNQDLLPMFRAASNQAIDDAPSSLDHEVHIRVERDKGFKAAPSDAPNSFIVTDIGTGFDYGNSIRSRLPSPCTSTRAAGKALGASCGPRQLNGPISDSAFFFGQKRTV